MGHQADGAFTAHLAPSNSHTATIPLLPPQHALHEGDVASHLRCSHVLDLHANTLSLELFRCWAKGLTHSPKGTDTYVVIKTKKHAIVVEF